MLDENDLKSIDEIIRCRIEEKTEKLENLTRHVHNDVENMRRDLVMVMQKVDGVAFLHERTRREVEEAINNFDINLDELYSPIDAKDREEWLKHLKGEKTEKEELENNAVDQTRLDDNTRLKMW